MMPIHIRVALVGITLALPVLGGCSTWKKKPKEDTHITTQVEESFKLRWLEKRGAELVNQGVVPDTARRQALQEFRERYEFTGAARE